MSADWSEIRKRLEESPDSFGYGDLSDIADDDAPEDVVALAEAEMKTREV